jgi:hypothetical protein
MIRKLTSQHLIKIAEGRGIKLKNDKKQLEFLLSRPQSSMKELDIKFF